MKELKTETPKLKSEESCNNCIALSYDANIDGMGCFLKFEIGTDPDVAKTPVPNEPCLKSKTWEAFFNAMIERYNNIHVGFYKKHGDIHLRKLAEKHDIDPKTLPTDKSKALKEIKDLHAKTTT